MVHLANDLSSKIQYGYPIPNSCCSIPNTRCKWWSNCPKQIRHMNKKEISIQWKPLNVITLEQNIFDHNNRMITLTENTFWAVDCKTVFYEFINIQRMTALTVITWNGFYCGMVLPWENVDADCVGDESENSAERHRHPLHPVAARVDLPELVSAELAAVGRRVVVDHDHGRVVEHLVGPLVNFSFSVTMIFVTFCWTVLYEVHSCSNCSECNWCS